jgi:cyclohexyl-isocyanide hydratase
MTRRQLIALSTATAAMPAWSQQSTTDKTHDFYGLKHTAPDRPEEIAMLIYPGMTALDLVGPQQVFGYVMGTRVRLVSKTKVAVVTDTGLKIVPDLTFDECPDPVDILFVPGGGAATVKLMEDSVTTSFLAARGKTARLVTSVCSGSLVLGAAGLLRGYKATSHWAVRDVLALLGATPTRARVVEDRNRITAGGITSGIDFGLRIAARLRGDDYGRALELNLEYDPQPPFGSGTPEKADERVTKAMRSMYQPLTDAAAAAAKQLKA